MAHLTQRSGAGARSVCLAILCATLPLATFAQETPKKEAEFFMGFGLSTTSIDKHAAGEEGIGSRGLGFQARWSLRYHEVFDLSAHFGGEYVKDKESFTQGTTGGTKKSSTWPVFGGVSTGLFTPAIRLGSDPGAPRLSFGGYVGYEWILSARRSISDCIDCRSEKLHLRSGMFLEPGLELYIWRRSGLGAYYRIFENDADFGGRFVIMYVMRPFR
ncbi:MAG: hypothetical protein ACE5G0_01200 [Rhodothermales bacterium]